MKLFEELKRRNVFRVTGVYAVVGWLVAQASALLESSLGLPGWFDGVIVAGLLLGFPVALVLAWAFELTPEGVKLTADLPAGASLAASKPSRLDYAVIAGAALVAILFAADRLTPEKPSAERSVASADVAASPPPAEASPPPAASIAVLPFADLSPGKDQQYFSDGVAEEILNVLARVEGLKVASRTSAFQFRETAQGVPAIARELGVRHVLEGSVRRSGDAIRVTAQLIDADTDAHLWSDTFDSPLSTETVFAIQDEIANAIVAALRDRIGLKAAEAPAAAAPTGDVGAYELYLRARALFQARRNLGEADGLLQEALAIDPRFADALVIRAAIHQFGGEYGARFENEKDARRIGRAFAEEALAINKDNGAALAVNALGRLYDNIEGVGAKDFEAIFADFDRAIMLNPGDANPLNWVGIAHTFVGHNEKAAAAFTRCVERDPLLAACRSNLARAYVSLGRLDEAGAVIDAAIDKGVFTISPGALIELSELNRRDAFLFQAVNTPALQGWRKFGALYEALRQPQKAHRALAAELERHLDETGVSARAYVLLNALGDYSRPLLVTHHWSPAYSGYRRSPEFKAHMLASGVDAYWREHGFPQLCKPVGKDDFKCE